MGSLILIVFEFIMLPFSIMAADIPSHYEPLIDSLKASGSRDLSLSEQGDTLRISYRPVGFRDEYHAFRTVYTQTEAWLKKTENVKINYIEYDQTNWGIPFIRALVSRKSSSREFQRDYTACYEIRNIELQFRSLPFLLQFDIPLKADFGNFYDPLIFRTGIRPDVRIMVKPGLVLYGQVDLYAHNEYDPHMWYNPANIGVMYAQPLHRKALSVTNLGAFNKELYGVDEEIRVSLRKDWLTVGVHGGAYGDLYFRNNRFEYTELNKYVIVFKVWQSYALYDCTIGLRGGRFLYGDFGYGFEISRIFKEIVIGANGIRSGSDYIANIEVRIPLFSKTRKTRANYGIDMVNNWDFVYRFNMTYDPYDSKSLEKAIEPEVGMSFREIEALARPVHFMHMLQN